MNGELKPYPAYRDSGVEWLGKVPEHWELRRLGAFGWFFKGNGGTKADETEEGVPCIRYGDLYTRHEFFITESKSRVSPHRAETYTPVCYGDVLFAGSGETLEEIGKSAVNMIGGPVVCGGDVIVFRPTIDLDAEFIGWSTDCRQAASQKARMGRGITVMHIYSSNLKDLAVALPPLPEQRAIARFLDAADRRIRRYIRAKERLIELLEERKRALIHEAVTGRFDVRTGQPYPAYKDSGVEWLGQVPVHWEVRRLKTFSQIRYGLGQPPREAPDGLPLIRATNVSQGQIVEEDMVYVDPTDLPAGRNAFLSEGEIVVVRSGAYTADSAIIPKRYSGAVTGYDMVATVTGALPEFVAFAALATYVRDDQLVVASLRAAQPHLNAEELGSARFFLPLLREQTAIVRYLDNTTATIDRTLELTRRQIALAKEYRTRLIADVVTGKLDVSEAEAVLPETDPLAGDRDRTDTIATESNLHSTESHMAKEAIP